jgi:hypothetical protein
VLSPTPRTPSGEGREGGGETRMFHGDSRELRRHSLARSRARPAAPPQARAARDGVLTVTEGLRAAHEERLALEATIRELQQMVWCQPLPPPCADIVPHPLSLAARSTQHTVHAHSARTQRL